MCIPISSAMPSSTSILSACAACNRASFGRPPRTDDITDAGDDFFSAVAAAAVSCGGWDDAGRRDSSRSVEQEAAARCSNTAPQRSYRPTNNILYSIERPQTRELHGMEQEAAARCSNTAPQRSYRPTNNISHWLRSESNVRSIPFRVLAHVSKSNSRTFQGLSRTIRRIY